MTSYHSFDFGTESRTTGLENASIAVLFAAEGSVPDLGRAAGALAVADSARFAEFYEMRGDFLPMDVGVYTEIVSGSDPTALAHGRAFEMLNRSILPIVVADSALPGFPPDSVDTVCLSKSNTTWNPSAHDGPVHLRVFFDAFHYQSGVRPKGLSWYELVDTLESIVTGPGVVSAELLGVSHILPHSPPALFAAQILVKLIGFLNRGLQR